MTQPRWSGQSPTEHRSVFAGAARFYEDDESLARIVVDFLGAGLEAGHPAILIATVVQRGAIVHALAARSIDVDALERTQTLALLDAAETLSAITVDGKLDARRFRDVLRQAVERVCRGRTGCPVRIFGQMTDVLWQRGQRDAAIQLEVFWNQLAHSEAPSALCVYAIGHFFKQTTPPLDAAQAAERIRRAHS